MNHDHPWAFLSQSIPAFCEELITGWIAQPGNTWSNIGFLVAGFWILFKEKNRKETWSIVLGWVLLIAGLGSAFYHASATFFGETLDYFGMFLGSAYMLCAVVIRYKSLSKARGAALFIIIFSGSLSIQYFNSSFDRSLYIAEFGVALLLELIFYLKKGRSTQYRYLFLCWSAFIPGYVFWWLDQEKIVCNPANHFISGHAIWHLLDALALFFLYHYYQQFARIRTGR